MLDSLVDRKIVESLRSGVPSQEAVRLLGSGQPQLERKFERLLEDPRSGLVLRAGFGEGKSHFLAYLEQLALERGYAVSRVVISKETPLYSPVRMLAAATENLRLPGMPGRGLDGIVDGLRHSLDTSAFAELLTFLDTAALSPQFEATAVLFANNRSHEELVDRLVRFWSGEKFTTAEIKRHLKQIGAHKTYSIQALKARELALQTFTFLTRLLRTAGTKGWVLLLDEVELIGRYTRLQRARAYAELGRWLGEWPGEEREGLVTIAAITSDFEAEVLERKGDRAAITDFLRLREAELSKPARRGIERIAKAERLVEPGPESLKRTYQILKEVHGRAYQWSPPDVTGPEMLGSIPMRAFVRAWINAFDLRRLYPEQRYDESGYELTRLLSDYTEQPDLQIEVSSENPPNERE
jgi:hypothetical protein